MRYFIEVKAARSLSGGLVHGQSRDRYTMGICGAWLDRPIDVHIPIDCDTCLAILEKQGRVE